MSVNRFASTYRPPSSASVQPRAPMSGGTYGTLPRRPSPGMNSAAPFGYQRPQTYTSMHMAGGVPQRKNLGTRSFTAEQAEQMGRVSPTNPYQMGVGLTNNVVQQRFPNFYNQQQQQIQQMLQQNYPFYDQMQQMRQRNIPGAF